MKPVHVALIVSTVYLIPSLLYIFLSTHFAADLATSPEQAATFELIKGAIYVTLAASIVFVSCWKAVTVFREKQHRLELMSQALLDAEHRATTNLLTASVAHDVRNELAILKSNNDFLRHHAGLEEITSDAVADQESAIERLIELSNQLVDAGNPDGDAPPRKGRYRPHDSRSRSVT